MNGCLLGAVSDLLRKSLRRGRDPVRLDAEVLAEAFEVLVEVQDADARMLSGGGDRQIGEREAMGAMGTAGCQLAHRRQDRTLHTPIYWNLPQGLQSSLNCGD